MAASGLALASVRGVAPRLPSIGPVLRVITMDEACTQLYKLLTMASTNPGTLTEHSPPRIAAPNATSGTDSTTEDSGDEMVSDFADPAQPLANRDGSTTDEPQDLMLANSASASPVPSHIVHEQHLLVRMVRSTALHLCSVADTVVQHSLPWRSHDTCTAMRSGGNVLASAH